MLEDAGGGSNTLYDPVNFTMISSGFTKYSGLGRPSDSGAPHIFSIPRPRLSINPAR